MKDKMKGREYKSLLLNHWLAGYSADEVSKLYSLSYESYEKLYFIYKELDRKHAENTK